jgi:hypothetical protein
MRTINITFEDAEFERLVKAKKFEYQPWREFILGLLEERFLLTESAETIFEGNVKILGNLTVDGNTEVD